MTVQIIIISILSSSATIFLIKYLMVRKSLKEIEEGIKEKLNENTNTLISVTSTDPFIIKIATSLNKEISMLKDEQHRFENGTNELKNAVTNIAHDIRTPLTSISGYLELLEEEELEEQPRRYVSIIRERTETLKDLSEELFKYSVVENTPNDMMVEDLVLNDEVEIALAAAYHSMIEKGISPEIHIPEEPVLRKLDRKSLQRILSNILTNAIRYTDGGIYISLSEEGCITISNPAPSLSEIDVGKLFDRYYTVENAKGSTGLGLSISKVLMERLGGTINAVYEEGNLKINLIFPEIVVK